MGGVLVDVVCCVPELIDAWRPSASQLASYLAFTRRALHHCAGPWASYVASLSFERRHAWRPSAGQWAPCTASQAKDQKTTCVAGQ